MRYRLTADEIKALDWLEQRYESARFLLCELEDCEIDSSQVDWAEYLEIVEEDCGCILPPCLSPDCGLAKFIISALVR